MSCKDNLTIYEEIYQQATLQYGLFDEVRVDQGQEGRDMEIPRLFHIDKHPPHRIMIERMWVEVNQRVSYPIKCVLIQMTESNFIDLNNDACKYSVQLITSNVAKIGLERFISSWNAYSVPNYEIPNDLQHQRSGTPIHPMELPLMQDAVDEYRRQGVHLTDPNPFATDPLGHDLLKEERNRRYIRAVSQGFDYEYLFTTLINGQTANLTAAVSTFASITSDLVPM